MRSISAAALLLVFVLVPAGAARENLIPVREPSAAADLVRHVRTLAADDMTGRGVDTPGIVKARDYIAAEFKKYGLAGGGKEGYFQTVEVTTGVETAGENTAKLADTDLTLGRDWTPLGFSSSGRADAEVVFVGYGITAAEYGYDDYAGIDAKGKIVVVLRYEPPPKHDKSPFGQRPRSSRHATLTAKAANARSHGAVGLVLLDPAGDKEELISLRRSMGRSEEGLVAIQVRSAALEPALQKSGVSLSELKARIDAEEKPHSIPLAGLKASLTVGLKKIVQPSDNVVAVLHGSDSARKGEAIVIGAHYDHLGFGRYGTMDPKSEGQIHHGADDNASGTAVMLGLAARFAREQPAPPRTIVFVAFTGEELGLYGSRYFAAHPPASVASIKAMINLDMVGRMENNRLSVNSADSAKEFRGIFERAARGIELEMKATGGGSDHVSFHRQNVPAVHFYTGMHADYHRPSDQWEKLNIDGMTKIGDLVFAAASELASTREPLAFVRPPSGRDG